MKTRRRFLQSLATATVAGAVPARAAQPRLELSYLLASALYGDLKLEEILPEVKDSGGMGLDVWCLPHGSQREQITAMGDAAFAALLAKHQVKLVVSTRYPLGPYQLQEEMAWVKKHGGKAVLCGCTGPKNPVGTEAKKGIITFLEQMKPHADAAGEHGLTIAIENHADSLLSTPDSIRYWAEFNTHPSLGVAFAPHHLHEHADEMPELIRALGAKNLPFVYFQEHGVGSKQKVAKEIELRQLPGYGTLDYLPILRALREVGFHGWAEIFMHPTPRGAPILPTAKEITAAVNKSRAHLESLLQQVNA